jgi:hypothetical protein
LEVLSQKQLPPPGHYSWKRPKAFIDTDLSSEHDPKEKREREFWDRQNIFNVSCRLTSDGE